MSRICVYPYKFKKNTHIAIYYQSVRDAHAAVFICVLWITGEFNLVDLFTKKMTSGNSRHILVETIFSNIEYPIGGIEKVYVYFHMGAYN